MRLRVNDEVMYEGEMMRVVEVGPQKSITLEWVDDSGENHAFGPFDKDEYKEWPVL